MMAAQEMKVHKKENAYSIAEELFVVLLQHHKLFSFP